MLSEFNFLLNRYKLVAFTLNVLESTSVKLVKMEERRRIPSYAQAQRV